CERKRKEADPRAQCVECGLMLSNEALKPLKLKRHLETKHPTLARKPQMQELSVVSLTGNSKCALKSSYLVSRLVSQSKKSFTIVEELILPAPVHMFHEMIGEAAAKKVLTILLSNNTASHHITDMALDIQHQLLERIKSSSLMSRMVHYCWFQFVIAGTAEDMLFCGELPTRATAQECFRCIDNYFTENDLNWQNCVGIFDCAPEAKWTHCFLYCEILVAKKMSLECFTKLCEDMEAGQVQLLYRSEVRWLSRGLVLKHLERKSPLAHYYANSKLSYLCDVFSLLNQLNISLQGRNRSMSFVTDKVEAFKSKLALLTKRAQEKRMDMFSLLSLILENSPQVKISDSHFKVAVGQTGPGLLLDCCLKGCLALRAVKFLPFTTTYLCESGFSTRVFLSALLTTVYKTVNNNMHNSISKTAHLLGFL
uniref:HAT C-terminal dimerisation domain-containing protein n=1 Tax=Maylandia zebra TaxID=106582 RepID=A0A3P9BQV1_9CICH